MKKLTDKQVRFCQDYLIDFNASQAAIRADNSKVILRELKESRVIRFRKLGTFPVSVSSSVQPTDEEVHANSIRKARILYRAEKELCDVLKLLQIKKQNPPSLVA